jgi:hypothetical protein
MKPCDLKFFFVVPITQFLIISRFIGQLADCAIMTSLTDERSTSRISSGATSLVEAVAGISQLTIKP